MSKISKSVPNSENLTFEKNAPTTLESFFYTLNTCEIGFVQWAVKTTRPLPARKALVFINHLGNGWIYAVITLSLLLLQGLSSWRLIAAAGLAALLSHCVYPLIKKSLARERPCDYDPSLPHYAKVLDPYSCPSGHVMTATAVGIPLIIMLPELIIAIVIGYLLIAWTRVALGHHYPSDLLFGATLGAVISLPVSKMVL